MVVKRRYRGDNSHEPKAAVTSPFDLLSGTTLPL